MSKLNIKEELKTLNKNKSISEILLENKSYIYPSLTYVAGLLIGSFLYTYSNPLSSILQGFFTMQINGFVNLFINRLCIYITIYTFSVLFGLCLIGFPFVNVIPFAVGIEIGLKISYYYINYSVKGIGYSLLMIIPESAAFVTVLIHSITLSSNLSKSIYKLTTKTDTAEEIDLKPYLKSYLLYGFITVIIALINAGAIYILNSIVTI